MEVGKGKQDESVFDNEDQNPDNTSSNVVITLGLPATDPKSSSVNDSAGNEKAGFSKMLRSFSSKVFNVSTDEKDQETVTSEKKRSEEETNRLIEQLKAEVNKPYDYHYWVRAVDNTGTIYYYNTKSGETSWLPICSICAMPSEKWCTQCNAAFCKRHLIKRHQPKKSAKLPPIPSAKGGKSKKTAAALLIADDNSSLDSGSVMTDMMNHEWSDVEIVDPSQPIRPMLMEGEEYCLECQLRVAAALCNHCWDAYCTDCFQKVHRVGSLRRHIPLPYHEARAGWFKVRAMAGNPEYYVNGSTGEATYEKPRELMNELEGQFYDGWKINEKATIELTMQIEELQFEVEKAKYEKEKMLADMSEMSANFKVKAANAVTSGVDVEALFGQNESNLSEYRQVLLNPSDRKRGQARTQYIKALLEAPLPS